MKMRGSECHICIGGKMWYAASIDIDVILDLYSIEFHEVSLFYQK